MWRDGVPTPGYPRGEGRGVLAGTSWSSPLSCTEIPSPETAPNCPKSVCLCYRLLCEYVCLECVHVYQNI